MSLRFKIRAPNGSQKMLGPIPSSSTMEQLQNAIIKVRVLCLFPIFYFLSIVIFSLLFDLHLQTLAMVNVLPSCIEIKFIYPPPKVISEVPPNTTLSSLQLTSGNLIVSVLDSPPNIAQPPPKEQNPKDDVDEIKQDIPEQEEPPKNPKNQKNVAPKDIANGTMTVKAIDSDNSCLFNAVNSRIPIHFLWKTSL